MSRKVMIQGTMSGAGKSLLTAGILRALAREGAHAAPFKSQNMALNSYVTADGLEIGRAQAMQAEAAGIAPEVEMNPILLKPNSDTGSQVIVNGRVYKDMSARAYFAEKKKLVPVIKEAWERLEKKYDTIVIEGAGSPAEINLKDDDIVNMGLARMLDAPVLLAADIDRGGVFAQIYGTVMLLPEEERRRIKGIVINEFRGDVSLLTPGIRQIEELCGIPVVGVMPYLHIDIDDEDSLSERLERREGTGLLKIAVVRLPHLSNYTDFAPLESDGAVNLIYTQSAEDLDGADLIILPGSKNTGGDLRWLRRCGLDIVLKRLAGRGTRILGICGGYQMLGESILTEDGEKLAGLGLLPVRTVFEDDKITRQVQGKICASEGIFSTLEGMTISGYEIHMGRTEYLNKADNSCFAHLTDSGSVSTPDRHNDMQAGTRNAVRDGCADSRQDGCACGPAAGTYVHGLFEEDGFREGFLSALCQEKGIPYEKPSPSGRQAYRQAQYDALADAVLKHLDMAKIKEIMEEDASDHTNSDHTEPDRTKTEYTKPQEIEQRSMQIIENELLHVYHRSLDPVTAPVVKRVIHTTADFGYADTLSFSEGAAEKGMEALRAGTKIVTDTMMAMSGINKKRLAQYGGSVLCCMQDPDVAEEAKARGLTRAAVSMEKMAGSGEDYIYAIGNAPTALITLYDLVREGKIHPKLIIGVPVGFVNVVEAKELILKLDVPFIVARGRRGGSNVAAAIVNALLYQL
ncbi:MAG: cobyric acid synthase [Lachnospiraceae bacterium]|nr:cobyric acid synthase [Lachnospiraceae bacterium]